MTEAQKRQCDVVIVGLGPAGSSAAKICADAGLSVIGIESKAKAGFPVQCAEFVPSLLTNETMAAYHQSQQLIDKMTTFVEQEAPDIKVPFSGRIISREAFDSELAEDAANAGAELWFGVKVCEVGNCEIVTSDGRVIFAKAIIGADGPHSVIGKAIGSINTETLETRQITIPLLDRNKSTDIFLSHEYVGGYGWLFPKNGIANLGIGVLHNERHKLKPLLNQLHHRLIKENRVGSEIIGYSGGAIPVNGMLKPFGYVGNVGVLLAGDAAGLTNPITGAGIPAAVISGKMAGEAMVKHLSGVINAFDDYFDDLNDLFGAPLLRARNHFRKLLQHHQNGNHPSPKDLRGAWIAYDNYWHERFENAQQVLELERKNDLLKA